MNLRWMVYRYDINKRDVEVFNIFDHYSFAEYVGEAFAAAHDKNALDMVMRRALSYYFRCKAEYEISVCGRTIDIYDQVMNNWDAFIDYVWNSKKG
jgi:hypothetical protein